MTSNRTTQGREVLRSALLLAACATLAAALLAGTERLTREDIADARAQAEINALSLVLPPWKYDNLLAEDHISVLAPTWLGSQQPLTVWRARRAGAPAGLVLQAVARDGYAGAINLRIGVAADGRITGVRVVEHRETPGLGDWIEAERSDWIQRFTGLAVGTPSLERWAVKRDGGDFDQFAGATITPRAVVRAVRRTLQYVELHADALYSAPAGSELEHADGPRD